MDTKTPSDRGESHREVVDVGNCTICSQRAAIIDVHGSPLPVRPKWKLSERSVNEQHDKEKRTQSRNGYDRFETAAKLGVGIPSYRPRTSTYWRASEKWRPTGHVGQSQD